MIIKIQTNNGISRNFEIGGDVAAEKVTGLT